MASGRLRVLFCIGVNPFVLDLAVDLPRRRSRSRCGRRRLQPAARDHLASGATLWKYLKIEARIGRELFFGNE